MFMIMSMSNAVMDQSKLYRNRPTWIVLKKYTSTIAVENSLLMMWPFNAETKSNRFF